MSTAPPGINTQLITNKISVGFRAKIVGALASWIPPDLKSEGSIHRAIAEDRARGPAYPLERLRLEINEREKIFRASKRDLPSSALRIFYLHGGAYILDFQKVQWKFIWNFLPRINAEIIIPIYPLALEHNWHQSPNMVRQTYLALINKDGPKNIAVVGDSASGGLASGLHQPTLERRDPVLSINFLRDADSMWASDQAPTNPLVNLLFDDHENLPPTLVFIGTRDILDSDAIDGRHTEVHLYFMNILK